MWFSTLPRLLRHALSAIAWWGTLRLLGRIGGFDLRYWWEALAAIGLAGATAEWTARMFGQAASLERPFPERDPATLAAATRQSEEALIEETAALRTVTAAAHDARCPACGHLLAADDRPVGLLTHCPHCHSGVAVRVERGRAVARLT